jgi:hypothetical protein
MNQSLKPINIMKDTVRSLPIVLILMFVVSAAMAQFSGGLELGVPIGDFSKGANVGFGASVRYDKEIKEQLNWTASIGYLSYGLKGSSGVTGHTSMIPIMAGIKYYFSEANSGFYGGADIGFVPITVSVDVSGFGSSSASETRFAFAPGVGYRMGQFDFAARFNIISDFNAFGIRAAYVFGSK